jgi:cytochrome c553
MPGMSLIRQRRQDDIRVAGLAFLRMMFVASFCSAALVVACRAESPAVRNCTWCHSTQGLAPAPRLAGQQPQYIESQLADFRTHARDNPLSRQYMWDATANLGAQSTHELAMYFSRLAPRAAGDGDAELAVMGKRIYQEGMPEANIVACVVCHGPNAEGIARIPRLGGLAATYLKRRLEQWAEGYDAAAPPPMPHIASKLSASQIDALASYLSFVK